MNLFKKGKLKFLLLKFRQHFLNIILRIISFITEIKVPKLNIFYMKRFLILCIVTKLYFRKEKKGIFEHHKEKKTDLIYNLLYFTCIQNFIIIKIIKLDEFPFKIMYLL